MARPFEGNSVFISGASAGIGAALAVEFAEQGARVAVAARRADKVEEVCRRIADAGGESLAVDCDVTKRASIDAAISKVVETFGGLDVAIANAGFGVSGPFARLSTEDFRRQFETNVFGVVDTVDAVLPHLIKSKGRLALVSSVFGRLGGPASSAYCASKFAVCGLAESLYYELADVGVSVTCINPGMVASQLRMVDNRGRFHPERKDPAPSMLVMSAEKAAKQMIQSIRRRRFDVVITRHGKLVIFLNRHFPRSFRLAFRLATKGRLDKVEKAKRGPRPSP